ncbi:hypothetical protein ACHAQG_000595 [Verticillium nonalfalfae]
MQGAAQNDEALGLVNPAEWDGFVLELADSAPEILGAAVQVLKTQTQKNKFAIMVAAAGAAGAWAVSEGLEPLVEVAHKFVFGDACARCRRGKSKCDGDRPVCGSCKRKKTACVYDVAETNTTRAMAARQQQANQRLENEQLHELFRILRTLPHADAHAALDQLRTADNALSALRSLTGSQLMIYRLDEFPDPQGGNLRLEAIDRGALVDSPFKVEARPWTAVAGSGIVSELISSFFTWDASFFYPFVYRSPSVYMDEVLVSVLRPLDPNTVFLDDLTVKDICLGLAYTDTTYMMRYIKEYTLRDYSCVVLCGLYNALFTMAPYLGDPTIHQLFAETSYLMRQTARDFPMSSFILQAIKAFAWTSSLPLPIAAAPYFEDLGMTKQELQDLPLGFALPKTNEIRDIFMREGQELSGVAVDMGKLLSRWCTLSLDE